MILITNFGRGCFYNSKVCSELDKDLARKIINDKKNISYEVLFIEYLTDIMLEVKEIQAKAAKNEIEEINKHAAKIKSTILAMMNFEFENTIVFSNFCN